MPSFLDDLPPELYAAIISHLPADSLQKNVLALTRAIPRSPVPLHHLFEHIRLKHAQQVIQLYLRLRNSPHERHWVKDFGVVTWTVDADVLLNLLGFLPHVSYLLLFVGPNFSPEHLEEIFHKPRQDLRVISLRFRPYVNRATYYQFLKGAYFDTTLIALSRWPPYKLPALSIIQDPLDPAISKVQHFAQPLVFFRLDPISVLLCSAYLASLTHLRLRIPSRQVSRFISSIPYPIPALRLLDLSTSNVLVSEMEAILIRFHGLQHLILDGCGVAREQTHAEGWINVGRTCALATIKRAKAREKELKIWFERNAAESLRLAATITPAGMAQLTTRPVRSGRRGLATATISLREGPTTSGSNTVPVRAGTLIPKLHVVPSSPTLLSLSISSSFIPDTQHQTIREDFENGWNQGLRQLTAVKSRLSQSWKNGVQMMRMTADTGGHGLDGLEAVEGESGLDFLSELGVGGPRTPVLCLAGPDTHGKHTQGCGHNIALDVWNDTI